MINDSNKTTCCCLTQPHQNLNAEDAAKIDALLAEEVEDRVRALDAGLIDTISVEEVFKKLER
jgi:hypothetical protein